MKRKLYLIISIILIYMLMVACAASTAVQAQLSPTTVPSTSTPAIIAATAETASPEITVSAGSSSSPVIKSGTYMETMQSGGQTREYIIHIPPSYNGSTVVPLVFMLHGYGGKAKGFELDTGMSTKADEENFIVAYPQAYGTVDEWNYGFSSFTGLPGDVASIDDVAFIRALLARLQGNFRIDPKRIYVGGFSAGAFMTYRLGAEMSDQLAAIAVAEGTIGAKQINGAVVTIQSPINPLPLIAFHGKADGTVYYNGGGPKGIQWFSFADSIAFWVKQDGCTLPPQEQTSHNGNIIEADYQACQAGTEIAQYTIVNGIHEWPTLQDRAQLSATNLVWDFFAKHPKP